MVAQSQGNEESRLVDTASQVTNHDIPSVAVNVGEPPGVVQGVDEVAERDLVPAGPTEREVKSGALEAILVIYFPT